MGGRCDPEGRGSAVYVLRVAGETAVREGSVMKLVFGTGTGRCGSKSLAILFGAQGRVAIAHERFSMPWEHDYKQLEEAIELTKTEPLRQVITQGDPVRWLCFPVDNPMVAGDVAPGHLSYAEPLIELGAKIVCLKRDKAATVDSFLRQRFDHCSLNPAAKRRPEPPLWPILPKFDLPTRKEAAEAFWEFFYEKAEALEAKWPDAFRIWPTEAMNSDEGQLSILAFTGVQGGRTMHVDTRYTHYSCSLFGGDGGDGRPVHAQ